MLVDSANPRKQTGVTPEQLARMEREVASVQGQYKLVEQSYGQDVLNLVLAQPLSRKAAGQQDGGQVSPATSAGGVGAVRDDCGDKVSRSVISNPSSPVY